MWAEGREEMGVVQMGGEIIRTSLTKYDVSHVFET